VSGSVELKWARAQAFIGATLAALACGWVQALLPAVSAA
jgi:hypothetical protein